MGSRRVNLIIVAVVLALLAGSFYVITTKETKLGLDLSGGTQLIYEAEPTAQNPTVDGEDIDRVIDIFRDRVDALGVAEPEFAQVGENQGQASLPDGTAAAPAEQGKFEQFPGWLHSFLVTDIVIGIGQIVCGP